MRRALPAILLVLLPLLLAGSAHADTLTAGGLRLVKIDDFASPVQVVPAPGDDRRLFVVEQGSGTTATIRVVRDGVTLAEPFLTLTGVAHLQYEQGLLSMAFAPDYATSGLFYVYYVDDTACEPATDHCDVRVDEFRRLDADRADDASRRAVFSIDHRQAHSHNGGQLQFGPDGLLYAGPGDGGTADDPECDAQNPASLLGKIVRIDPRAPGATPQVYAMGLRNPYRFSFDHLTGDLLIGDVGGIRHEEIDFLPAGTPAGLANFGWNRFEGNEERTAFDDCITATPPGYVAPAIAYDDLPSGPDAVIGGYVVRDTSVAPLLGRYAYADIYRGDIRSAVVGPSTSSGDGLTGLHVDMLSSFGEDARTCRIYVTSLAGPVYRLEAETPPGPAACATATGPPAPGPPPASPPAPLQVAGDRVAPALSGVTVSRRRFRVSALATPTVARTRTPAGTVFRFRLSEDAEVTARFYRHTGGRRARYVLRGALTRRAVTQGRRLIRFSGRVGRRALPAGRYRATLRARDRAGNLSAGQIVHFQIVSR